MTAPDPHALTPTRGLLGVFLIVLGGGIVLDVDLWWSGGALVGIGAWLLVGTLARAGELS